MLHPLLLLGVVLVVDEMRPLVLVGEWVDVVAEHLFKVLVGSEYF